MSVGLMVLTSGRLAGLQSRWQAKMCSITSVWPRWTLVTERAYVVKASDGASTEERHSNPSIVGRALDRVRHVVGKSILEGSQRTVRADSWWARTWGSI